MLMQIALPVKQLNVAVFMASTKSKRHNVVKVIIAGKRPAATSAPAFLQLDELFGQSYRKRSNMGANPCAPFGHVVLVD